MKCSSDNPGFQSQLISSSFDFKNVLNTDLTLNVDKWKEQAPLLISPYFALSYAMSFAAFTSVITHVLLWHRTDIARAFRTSRNEKPNIHMERMKSYSPVPARWFLFTLLGCFVLAAFLVHTSPLQLPVTGLMLALAMAAICIIPIGIVQACTSLQIGMRLTKHSTAAY